MAYEMMRTLNRIYKMTVNLYPRIFPRPDDETVWIVEDTTEAATRKLRMEFEGIVVSGVSPIFGCILAPWRVSYDTSIYLVNMVLNHDSEIAIHVLSNDFPDIMNMCTERYLTPKKIEIQHLTGTVLPEYGWSTMTNTKGRYHD